MMETRLTREMEKNRSVLAKARGPVMTMGAHEMANNSIRKPGLGVTSNSTSLPMQEEADTNKPVADSLTDGQRQLFEKGNQDMLKHLESTLDKVRWVFFSVSAVFASVL